MLLPRSGVQAGIGQDCQRGVEIAPAILKDLGLPELADHERRHRDQRRGGARARREADHRRRAAPGRRLRLRPDHRDRPGGRAEGHPVRHQHRRGAADHRAGLQVRVPQFPDRADDPRRRLRQPEGDLRGDRHGAEVGRVHARQRHLRHRDAEGHRRRHAEVQHALQDRRDHRLRSDRARPLGRGGEGQGDRRRRAADGQPPQRRHPAHPRAGQAALVADGRAQHGAGLVRGPVPQDARQARRTVR